MKTKIHIKVGDVVKIISGNLKGSIGKVVKIQPKISSAILDSIPNRLKRKKNQTDLKKIPRMIHTSNLMLWDNILNRASRVRKVTIGTKKIRFFLKSNNIVSNDND